MNPLETIMFNFKALPEPISSFVRNQVTPPALQITKRSLICLPASQASCVAQDSSIVQKPWANFPERQEFKKTSQHAKGQAVDLEIFGVPNIKTAYWLQNNVDFDQLIMEYYDPTDPAGGWVHISYHESGSNRKQVLTFDGKKYTEGLPDMEWKDGKVIG